MTNSDSINKILTDDGYIKQELDKIALYFNLKHTIRWAKNRGVDVTESVAEHVYGMHVLNTYFLPLIDPKKELNYELISAMITWHDMAEAIVSDMTTVSKTEQHKAAEKDAEVELLQNATAHLRPILQTVFSTYDQRITPESQFVKALDKIEPIFHLYFLKQQQIDINAHFSLEWGADEYRQHRFEYINAFPIIKRFDDILHQETKQYYPAP